MSSYRQRLGRYLAVGAFVYVCEMAILALLTSSFGQTPAVAVAVSYWTGMIVAFVLQKIIAFSNKEYQKRVLLRQSVLYGILVVWNFLFTELLVHFLAGSLSVMAVRTIAIVIITAWNFLLYHYIFKSRQPEHATGDSK
jgi:putative flippase GtrA